MPTAHLWHPNASDSWLADFLFSYYRSPSWQFKLVCKEEPELRKKKTPNGHTDRAKTGVRACVWGTYNVHV